MAHPKIQRILITGGAGFIGSNLCESLIDHYEVICFDNLSTGSFSNIAHLKDNHNFSFFKGDIRNFSECQKAVKNVDAVLHHAALGSIQRSVNDPKTSNDVNISGFLNVLTAASEAKVKRFIYASSSSIYGDHPTLPKKEDLIGNPLSPYAITKRANELYARCFADLFQEMEILGFRYFNIFGKRQSTQGPYAAVIPKFIQSILNEEQIVIYGDGNQTRDFTYIGNVIQANWLALRTTNSKAFNQIYNIACGESISLNQLIQNLTEALPGHPIKLVYTNPRPGEVLHSLASINKANKLLEFYPFYTFKEGLRLSINWYKENLTNELSLASKN